MFKECVFIYSFLKAAESRHRLFNHLSPINMAFIKKLFTRANTMLDEKASAFIRQERGEEVLDGTSHVNMLQRLMKKVVSTSNTQAKVAGNLKYYMIHKHAYLCYLSALTEVEQVIYIGGIPVQTVSLSYSEL